VAWGVGWYLVPRRVHFRAAKGFGLLPHIDEALRTGKVSYCKVRAMTRVATPANEQVLLMDAQLTTGSQLERVCRKYRQLRRNEDGANAADDDRDRYLRRRDLDNGMVSIEAVCHPEEAALIWAAIEQATKELLAARRAEERACLDSPADSTDVPAEPCTAKASDSACDSTADVPAEACAATASDSACDSTADVPAETFEVAADNRKDVDDVEDVDDVDDVEDADAVDDVEDADAVDDADVYEDDCAFFERFGVSPEPRPEPVFRTREDHEEASMPFGSTQAPPSTNPGPPPASD